MREVGIQLLSDAASTCPQTQIASDQSSAAHSFSACAAGAVSTTTQEKVSALEHHLLEIGKILDGAEVVEQRKLLQWEEDEDEEEDEKEEEEEEKKEKKGKKRKRDDKEEEDEEKEEEKGNEKFLLKNFWRFVDRLNLLQLTGGKGERLYSGAIFRSEMIRNYLLELGFPAPVCEIILSYDVLHMMNLTSSER